MMISHKNEPLFRTLCTTALGLIFIILKDIPIFIYSVYFFTGFSWIWIVFDFERIRFRIASDC